MLTAGVAVLGVVAILALLGLSAFFSSSETAIFTLTDAYLDARSDSTDRGMATLRELRGDPHRLLVTILVGNNVVNVAIASITTALLIEVLPAGSAVFVGTVVVSVLVLIVGEIVPKSYGLGHAATWAPRVAGPVRLVERVLSPLVIVFDAVTRRINRWLGGDSVEGAYLEE